MTFVLQRRSKKNDNMSHDTGRSQYTRFIFFYTIFGSVLNDTILNACAQPVSVKTHRVIDEIHVRAPYTCVYDDSRQRRLAERI